jgi:prophage tail gpP-like protein
VTAQETCLPELVDCRGIMEETGVKRATAERLMRGLAKYRIGVRVFVARADARGAIEKLKVDANGGQPR